MLSMKYINDAILQNIGSLRQHLHLLSANTNKATSASTYRFRLPGRLNRFELIEFVVDGAFDHFTGLFKAEI